MWEALVTYKGADYIIEDGVKIGKTTSGNKNVDTDSINETRTVTKTVTRTVSPGGSGVMNSDSADAKDFVINISTHKYHHPNCKSVGDILSKNRDDVHATVEDIESVGYKRCKNCSSGKYGY